MGQVDKQPLPLDEWRLCIIGPDIEWEELKLYVVRT